jgi:AcrR family transcriptional regulator
MTGEFTIVRAGERARLAAAIVDGRSADYVTIRAVTALSEAAHDRIARLTGMGRQFAVDVRRRVREAGACALLGDEPSLAERILETATHQIVQPGREFTMRTVSDETGIPRRTLYNAYPSSTDLLDACRRRAQTIWRARFEQRVLAPQSGALRVLAVVDAIEAWVGSERFHHDQALRARASFAKDLRDDDLRDHLAEVDRFATALAADAGLCAPAEFGAFVATLVAGATGWFDRPGAARAASVAIVERFIVGAQPR